MESNQFQAFLASRAGQESLVTTGGIPIVALTQTANKQLRIESLQPDLDNGYILVQGEGQQLLKEQLEQYPNTSKDDGPDALEMCRVVANSYSPGVSASATVATVHSFGNDYETTMRSVRTVYDDMDEMAGERIRAMEQKPRKSEKKISFPIVM
jgi:hypothetical protein